MKLFEWPLAAMAFVASMALAGAAFAAEQTESSAPAKDLVLRDDAKCTVCHDEGDDYPVLSIGKTRHGVVADKRTPTCTSCHGDSEKHLHGDPKLKGRASPDVIFRKGTYAPVEAEVRIKACLACHETDASRTHWSGSAHEARDVACTSCHQIHTGNDKVRDKRTQPEVCFTCHKEQRAQIHLISTHPLAAGKIACSDCHNPHGSTGPKLLKKASVVETCYQCHAEKRGPFLWEHPPASDDCMNCHTPHGSTNAGLLRMRSPWLCQRCHADGPPHPGNIYGAGYLPGGTINTTNNPTTGATSYVNPLTGKKIAQTNPLPQMALRGCPNCHSQIHGSNHPAGVFFAR